MATTDVLPRTFNATDRCDSCNAQAVTEAVKDGWATSLLFCGNHARKHVPALNADDLIIVGFDPRDAAFV